MPGRKSNSKSNSPVVSNEETQMNSSNLPFVGSVSPVVENKESKMTDATTVAAHAFQNARTYHSHVNASISLTEEDIERMSVRTALEALLIDDRIKFTRAANETRRAGVSVLFTDRLQADQMGRAFALVTRGVHLVWASDKVQGGYWITLIDPNGDNDRAIFATEGGDGKVYYTAYYASKKYNDMGSLIGLRHGGQHPIDNLLRQRIDSYNNWVDAYNKALIARANGVATPEQITLTKGATENADWNVFVRNNSVRTITHVVNKYVLEAWLLLDSSRPAFEIFTWSRNEEQLQRHIDNLVAKMERPYKNELRKLAGLVQYDENKDGEGNGQ